MTASLEQVGAARRLVAGAAADEGDDMYTSAMLRLGMSTATLWWEAGRVIAMRSAILAAGGAQAQREYDRLIPEKIAALIDAQMGFGLDLMTGRAAGSPQKTVSLYRRRVRSNYRRLRAAKP